MTGPPGDDIARPVFVDGTGRRRRVAVVSGVALGVGLLLSLVMIVAGLLGASPVRLPGLPGAGDKPPGEVRQPAVHSSTSISNSHSATRVPAPTVAPQPPAPTTTASPTPAGHPRGGPSRPHPGRSK